MHHHSIFEIIFHFVCSFSRKIPTQTQSSQEIHGNCPQLFQQSLNYEAKPLGDGIVANVVLVVAVLILSLLTSNSSSNNKTRKRKHEVTIIDDAIIFNSATNKRRRLIESIDKAIINHGVN